MARRGFVLQRLQKRARRASPRYCSLSASLPLCRCLSLSLSLSRLYWRAPVTTREHSNILLLAACCGYTSDANSRHLFKNHAMHTNITDMLRETALIALLCHARSLPQHSLGMYRRAYILFREQPWCFAWKCGLLMASSSIWNGR